MQSTRFQSLLLLLVFSACVDPLRQPPGRQRGPGGIAPAPWEEGTERSSRTSRGSRAPKGVSYTTIEDILQRPTLFHKRWVRLKGRVAEARFSPARRGRSSVITIVYLSDHIGNTMEVMIEDNVLLRAGQEVTVEGRAMLLSTASSRAADVVITAARVVTALAEKNPADKNPPSVTPPKSPPVKTAPTKGNTPRESASPPQDEDGRIF